MKKQTYKKLFTVATASAMAAGAVVAVAPTQADAASPFSDVKESNTHYTNIVELTSRGIITGYEDGTYRPGQAINRAQVAKLISRALQLDTENVVNPKFSDVPTSSVNYGPIAALQNAGIIDGYQGKYNPAGTLTRGQMAKIISNAFNLEGGDVNALPFTDVKTSQYAQYIANLYANGVTTGVTATRFDEKSAVTRGQLASFLARAEKVAGNETPGSISTVEKAVTLLNVTDKLVTINGEQFDIAPEVVGLFNADNAAALKEADTTLVIEYTVEKTASLANVAAKKGKIVGVKSLKITQSGVKFDAKGYTLPSLTIAGNNVTVENVITTALDVAAGNNVTLNNVVATALTAGKGAKLTIDANTKLATIKLASGDKIENVIANYAAVKDALKDTKVEQSSGGGGGGSSTGSNTNTTTAQVNAYTTKAENALKSLDLIITDSISLQGTTLTLNITTGATAYVVADLLEDVNNIAVTLAPLKKDTLNYVTSVKIGNATPITKFDDELGLLELGQVVATPLFGKNPSFSELANASDLRDLIGKNTGTSVVVTFKNNTSKTYKVVVNNLVKK